MTDLITRLAAASAVSGRERAVCEIIKNELSSYCETFYLPSGDLIVKKSGFSENAKKILIATNVDVRGFFVTFIENDGKIRLALSDSEFAFSKHVGETLVSADGIKARLLSEKENEPRLSDIYAEVDESVTDRFNPGDVLSLETEITEKNERIFGLNSASRAVICAMIDSAKRISPENDIYFAFNSCGIPGGRGAKSATYAICPDVAISLRTLESYESVPLLLARDGMSLSSVELFDKAITCAENASIKISLSATSAGTRDAWSVSVSHIGVPTVSLALPCRDPENKSENVSKDTISGLSKLITVLGENILN